MRRLALGLALCSLLFPAILHAARLSLFIDGSVRTAYDPSRGKTGRAEWTAVVKARNGTILTDDFQGRTIDVNADPSFFRHIATFGSRH